MDWSRVDYLWIIVIFFLFFYHSNGTHCTTLLGPVAKPLKLIY